MTRGKGIMSNEEKERRRRRKMRKQRSLTFGEEGLHSVYQLINGGATQDLVQHIAAVGGGVRRSQT